MLSPLAYPLFRWLFIAFVFSALGTNVQDVAAEWLMTSQTLHPLQVALLVTAIRLPRVLLGIPAGAFSDVFGSRKVLIVTQAWMLFFAALMTVMVALNLLTPWPLLLLTFGLFLGMATQDPAMFAGLMELVPKREIPYAIGLQLTGFAFARLIGPALGGMMVRRFGMASAFAVNAVTYVAPLVVLLVIKGQWKPVEESTADRVSVKAALVGTLSLIRSSSALRLVLLFSALCSFCTTAQMALFPVLARTSLKLDSAHFGWAISCMNGGAIVGTLALPWLLRRIRASFVLSATLAFAGVAISCLTHLPPGLIFVLCVALGLAFASQDLCLFTAAQATAPSAVRGRVIGAMLTVCAIGSTLGSLVWGGAATRLGMNAALLLAGIIAVASGGLAAYSALSVTGDGDSSAEAGEKSSATAI